MTLNLIMPNTQPDLKPRITVFGVGGAGGNAVNNMIDQQLDGCEFVVANTDAQALAQSRATAKIQMGARVTEGLGAGARPAVGASAAEESIEDIVDHLAGAHMAFITAGMGGGTGTGAAPIIAQAARELGVLTVGVVTKPFQFEGTKRMRQADEGIEALQKVVDTLIIIPNQNLFRLANEKTTFTEAFAMADDVLYQGVKGVTDLMVRPGLINLDFADVRAVMNEMGKAMMGTGEADGDNRALQAAEKAIANPLLDEISLKGARGVLINVTGGYDLTLFELDEAANRIREEVDPDANIIVGSTLDPTMEGRMRVSVVATGIDVGAGQAAAPGSTYASAALPPKMAPAPAFGSGRPASQPQAQPQAPAAQPAHQAARPAGRAPAPQAAQYDEDDVMVEAGPERSLFSGLGMDHAGGYDAEDAGDAVPPPAYRPAAQPAHAAARQAPRQDTRGQGAGTADAGYIAPKPQAAAKPTPEALARLRAAIAQDKPRGAPAQPHGNAPQEVAQRSRFGINSLINRMTGHGDETPAAPERRQPPMSNPATHRPTPAPQAYHAPQDAGYDDMDDGHDMHATGAHDGADGIVDPEQERIEIPAFLRRQAN